MKHDLELPFLTLLEKNPLVDLVLNRSEKLGIKHWAVGAGFLQQTVFNIFHDQPVLTGIKDIDWVYFDDSDLSEESEQGVIARVKEAMSDIPLWMDVKNQARVHLWYRQKFGYDIQPYKNLEDAIATWPTTSTAVALTREAGVTKIIAPFGLSDLMSMTIRPNKRQITEEIYLAKHSRWKKQWQKIEVLPW